jgi:putative endonuclease
MRAFFFFYTMAEFVVYILFSPSSGKTYTGMTSDLITRFHFHNFKFTKGFTLRYRPWTVLHVEFFGSKKEALAREKELKCGKGREWVKQNILTSYSSVG